MARHGNKTSGIRYTYEDTGLKALCEALEGLGDLCGYSQSTYVSPAVGELFGKFVDTDKPDDGANSIYYSHLTAIPDGAEVKWHNLFVPEYMAYSDYSGGVVDRANLETFLEKYGSVEGVYEATGGYGTRVVAIMLSSITEEMVEVFAELSDYPCLDDEALSELETNLEDEDWDNWISGDFSRALCKKFPELEDEIDQMESEDPEQLRELYYTLKERTNTYGYCEDAVSYYIDIEALVNGAVASDFNKKEGK
jgi:hypothetical protein